MSSDAPQAPPGRPHLELLTAQLQALDAWHRAGSSAAESTALTREMRLDLNRRMEARRREQQALLVRASAQLEVSGNVLSGRARTRAVLAHRNVWLRDAVAARLTACGVQIVGAFEDGADTSGTVVVEQPELVLVEDRLPTLSGLEVVRRVREFSPDAVVGAQVLDAAGVAAFVDAGAHAVFTRRVPPAEMADSLLQCLVSGGRPVQVR